MATDLKNKQFLKMPKHANSSSVLGNFWLGKKSKFAMEVLITIEIALDIGLNI